MNIFTWKQRVIVIAVNISSLLLFAGGGYVLDRLLNIWPVISVIGFILSFLVGQFVLAKILTAQYHRDSKKL
jgi:F0F1-type ATP synthase assembly protein I